MLPNDSLQKKRFQSLGRANGIRFVLDFRNNPLFEAIKFYH